MMKDACCVPIVEASALRSLQLVKCSARLSTLWYKTLFENVPVRVALHAPFAYTLMPFTHLCYAKLQCAHNPKETTGLIA